jgi:PTS system N-acetylglucosamine-specific IIC component
MIRPTPDALQVVLGPIADQVAGEMRAYMKQAARAAVEAPASKLSSTTPGIDLNALVEALGGADNLKAVEGRSSRLLLELVDDAGVQDDVLKALGARGVVRSKPNSVHVLIGPGAELVAERLNMLLP